MEKKQGFFSALKDEVVRGLSPARSRAKSPARSGSSMSGLLRRRKQHMSHTPKPLMARSGSLRPETLTPLMEGPDLDGRDGAGASKREGWGHWMIGQLSHASSVSSSAYRHSDLRLLLGIMGAPLASTLAPLTPCQRHSHSVEAATENFLNRAAMDNLDFKIFPAVVERRGAPAVPRLIGEGSREGRRKMRFQIRF